MNLSIDDAVALEMISMGMDRFEKLPVLIQNPKYDEHFKYYKGVTKFGYTVICDSYLPSLEHEGFYTPYKLRRK